MALLVGAGNERVSLALAFWQLVVAILVAATTATVIKDRAVKIDVFLKFIFINRF